LIVAHAGNDLVTQSIPSIEQPLRDRFAALQIAVATHRHPPLHTVAQSRSLRGTLPGGHIKNLFLRDKKRHQFLVTVEEDREVDLKALRQCLGTNGNLSFGSAELLLKALGVTPGSVTPFAVMNDSAGDVTFVLDAGLMAHATLNAHPLHNEATVAIDTADLLRFAADSEHQPLLVDISAEAYQILNNSPASGP